MSVTSPAQDGGSMSAILILCGGAGLGKRERRHKAILDLNLEALRSHGMFLRKEMNSELVF